VRNREPLVDSFYLHRSIIAVEFRGLCTWTNILKNFRPLGKLSCLEFGDLFKVPPDVSVQCFQRLDQDHSDLRFQEN
jgi:hypothetical protein